MDALKLLLRKSKVSSKPAHGSRHRTQSQIILNLILLQNKSLMRFALKTYSQENKVKAQEAITWT